jgi:hypothetical protein
MARPCPWSERSGWTGREIVSARQPARRALPHRIVGLEASGIQSVSREQGGPSTCSNYLSMLGVLDSVTTSSVRPVALWGLGPDWAGLGRVCTDWCSEDAPIVGR